MAYAYSFISHLFRDAGIGGQEIKGIYLFGSVARGDFGRDSDVDIFIDSGSKDIGKAIERSLNRFRKSGESKKFQLIGVQSELKVMHGRLEDWELKESVEKDAILLYSPSSAGTGMRAFFIIAIEPVKDIAKRNRVIRKLAGRQEKQYHGSGLVRELGGEAVDSRVFLVPAEKSQKMLQVLSKENVRYSLRKMWA